MAQLYIDIGRATSLASPSGAHGCLGGRRALTCSAARQAASTVAAIDAGGTAAQPWRPKRRGRPRKRDPVLGTGTSIAGNADGGTVALKEPRARGSYVKKGSTVLLVESPAKARKIQEFLGPSYAVLASYGHVRDLPAKQGSVDPAAGFSMQWEVLPAARERLPVIADAVQHARRLLLATDPDREGEAISWHLLHELRQCQALPDGMPAQRITFTEVTKPAIMEALRQPRDISEPLVHAYMARRALDYLFGFHLSPLLWRKVPAARSAGRVQSVALRLVCEREAAIEAFRVQRYYTVTAEVALPGGGSLQARLAAVDGEAPPQPGFPEQQQADEVAARIAAADFVVEAASSKEQQRQPPPPFITSTLQQEANKRLGMSASQTMRLAQQLYEAGHITYMRTDGVSLSPAAVAALRDAAVAEHGPLYVPQEPRAFKSRSKNAQEAHEAIRPTDPLLTAEQLGEQGVERAAARLYGLIRSRALACQMSAARIAQVAADLASSDGRLRLRATASAVAFPGFMAAYSDPAALPADTSAEAEADEAAIEEQGDSDAAGSAKRRAQQEAARAAAVAALSGMQGGQAVAVDKTAACEHETRPPARFTEGSLVKQLEELGIGRPGTYAPILNLLQSRGYVRRQGRALHAEALGRVLVAFLQAYFPQYVDYEFTSTLEGQLDDVTGGGSSWQGVLGDFWQPFSTKLAEVKDVPVTDVINRLNAAVGDQLIGNDRACPSCGGELSIKFSSKRRGAPFVGCSQYPECKYARPIAAAWLPDGTVGDAEAEPGAADPDGHMAEATRIMQGFSGYARCLGEDPDSGLPVFVRAGLYGPYVQRGVPEDPAFKRQALPKHNMREVTLEEALELLALPRDLGPNPATGDSVILALGKFGPFVRSGVLSRSLPKAYDPAKLTLADALQVLAHKRKASARGKDGPGGANPASDPDPGDEVAGMPTRRKKGGKQQQKQATAAAPEADGEEQKGGRMDAEDDQGMTERAARARHEARIALDTAAYKEAWQLKAALGLDEAAARALEAARKDGKGMRHVGPNGFVVFLQREAGLDGRGTRWWKDSGLVWDVGERWKALPAGERDKYEREAEAARLELAGHALKLLPAGRTVASLSATERAQLEKQVARPKVQQRLDKALKLRFSIPPPRTAYNLFFTANYERISAQMPGEPPTEVVLRLSHEWRAASLQDKVQLKMEAEEEKKAYTAAQEKLAQQQQAATAAALAAGLPPVEAARAGLLAGAAVVQEYFRHRRLRTDKDGSPEAES